MRFVVSLFFILFTFLGFSQETIVPETKKSLVKTQEEIAKEKARIAPITLYKIITIERDTTFVDTSLTVQDFYDFNLLRKDPFGLLAFANEGQTYNTLQFGLNAINRFPEFGYAAKQFGYLQTNQINYYNVATAFTELYFKTVMAQGQSANAFATINVSENFNFSLGYKGGKSEGHYLNQATDFGSFYTTMSYNTKDKRYIINAHYAGQNLNHEENGGITTPEDFISKDSKYDTRITLSVYLNDAESNLKGRRLFADQIFRINKNQTDNNFGITEQFLYETKVFDYLQPTVKSTVGNVSVNRFGPSYVSSNIDDRTDYNTMYNKLSAYYENSTLGKFQFFIDDFRSNFYFNSVFVSPEQVIPSSLNYEINSIGGQYDYQKNKWNGTALVSTSISSQSMYNLDLKLDYTINPKNALSFQYQNTSKVPDNIYTLHQSSYEEYNWYNNFKNEKINTIILNATTQWVNVSLNATNLNDHLYFRDDVANDTIQIVIPKQYNNTIKYLSLKLSKDLKYHKFGLDNTFLFQKVDQQDNILNVPEFVTRNTLYFSEYFFKRALYMHTGITFNYFTNYYGNAHNPVIGEFFTQDSVKIGNYANFDYFLNFRIQQARIFFVLEHFNADFANQSTYFSDPNNPYRDFTFRFGLVWNFFQ
jgi:hypothetical protein